ncbi:MAG: hypothetical protein PHW63_05755 [Alphaproteobacteria bacterium]|nr:hypothetical protein [Alphaproteobacteria bacterium]
MIVSYGFVAILFFVIGQITTKPEDRNIYLAGLASALWPISVFAVLCHVLWSKLSEQKSKRSFS